MSLSPRQLDLLRRIIAGERPLTPDASSVYALRNRGLVTTASTYAYDTAQPTDAGRAAAVGDLTAMRRVPTPKKKRTAAARTTRPRPSLPNPATAVTTTPPPASAPPAPDLPPPDLGALQPILQPDLARLRKVEPDSDGWIITLRSELDLPHVRIDAAGLDRTVAVIEALVARAAERGHYLTERYDPEHKGGLWFDVDGDAMEVTFHVHRSRQEHVPTPKEIKRGRHVPQWDYTTTGRLELREGHSEFNFTLLAIDGRRGKVETLLDRALDRLEERAAVRAESRLAIRRGQEHRQREWEAAMRAAEATYVAHVRATHLDAELDAFDVACRIRTLTAALRTRQQPAETLEWIAWAEGYADGLDPVINGVVPLQIPKPTTEDLRPFLDGWSPSGPDHGRRTY
jgi:hypothetical protein